MSKLKEIWTGIILLSTAALVRSQGLSLFEIYPCSNASSQTVSRFKSDIYAIKPSFGNCSKYPGWPEGLAYNKTGLRVQTWITNSSITIEKAVVFVSRQGISDVSSWAIPFQPQGFDVLYFHEVSRTMCPTNLTTSEEEDDNSTFLFYVDVFTSSSDEIEYWIQVDVVPQFVLEVDIPVSALVGAASPQIFYFKFPDNSNAVTVEAFTEDNRCVLFSVQKNNCPINDLLETVRSRGIYQTMSQSAFLTVREHDMENREFVVVVITTNYTVCHKNYSAYNASINGSALHDEHTYVQNITILVRNLEPISSYALPMALPFIVFLFYVLLVCLYAFVLPRCYFTPWKSFNFKFKFPRPAKYCSNSCHKEYIKINVVEEEALAEETALLKTSKNKNYDSVMSKKQKTSPGAPSNYPNSSSEDLIYTGSNGSSSVGSDLEASVSSIATDLNESRHVLPRMCKNKYPKLRKQYTVYSWNTFTVGIFYALPAFQLVLSEQQLLSSTGDQDKCYYNFKCANPVSYLSAFNNIWSNVGYVLLGGLFFIIVWYRDTMYRKRREMNKSYIDGHGIPQFYGIYYGMAIALVLEGFMSAFYHICPSNANFQFDTAFMFIIGGLFLVKLFQKRHPDINVNAFIAFFTFAVVIFVTLIGLYVDETHPYAIRAVVFVFTLALIFVFLISFYNFHSWPKELKKLCKAIGEILNELFCCCHTKKLPAKKGRFVRLLVVALVNVGIAVIGIVVRGYLDIATCVLVFFVTNLLLFLAMYVLLKLWYHERLTVLPLFLVVVIGLLWLLAFVFFLGLTTTNWLLTPAESRTKNHKCFLMNFYDYHDIWHFFSASAMFFSFSFLLTLDDGVQHTPRDELRVF